ncbi:unnamed protein product [Fusarium equiseti]|uniref:Uncharacterized protein n=1 Tax=Fusarium equiseti TaxID=61235 RepID=A0A8J2NJT8_FUSEQ|nr:unnamed protein product [Fusarium equiseti]
MPSDTGSEGSFCCGLPFFKVFKKKTEEPGPIRQAVDNRCVDHQRHAVRIDDQGRPIDSQDQPIRGSILHQRDDVGGDTPRIASLLATPADLYGQVIAMNDLTPTFAGGPSAAGPSGGGTSAAGLSDGGPRAAGASSGGSSSAASKGKGDGGTEKKDPGDGSLAAAANLI